MIADRVTTIAVVAAVAIVVGAVAGFWLGATVYSAKLARAQAAADARETQVQEMLARMQAEAAASLMRERAAAATARQARAQAEREAELRRAALAAFMEEANRDPVVVAWGAQPVPVRVVDSLRLPAEARALADSDGREAAAAGGTGFRLPRAGESR